MDRYLKGLLAGMAALGLAGCSDDETIIYTSAAPTVFGNVYALTASNKLISFVGSAPHIVLSSAPLSGVGAGETVAGMDFRPANGALTLLTVNGATGYLYTVNTQTAVATRTFTLADDPADASVYSGVSGAAFGVDFNPVPDRLRVVSDTGQNLRINPATGLVIVDTPLSSAGTPRVVAAAYTNSFGGGNAATLTTTLYGIDSTTDRLVMQGGANGSPSPNGGVLTDVGTGIGFNTSDVAAFDIAGDTGVAYAVLTAAGGGSSRLYSVNLATGAGTPVGTVGGGEAIQALAIPAPAPALAYAVTETHKLLSFTPAAPDVVATVGVVSGLQTDERIVGLDVRPLTGELFALGSTGRLYVVNRVTAAATLLTGVPLAVTGTAAFGFDFNPTVDRIRIVDDAEENLRAHPDTGNLAGTDTALSPAGDVVAAAYDRNFAGAAVTTLFGIDAGTDMLVLQGGVNGTPSPNLGAITSVGALNVDTSTFAAFDIVGGQDGMALAALNVGGATTSNLYRINLTTGAATQVGSSPIGGGERITGFAVRLSGN